MIATTEKVDGVLIVVLNEDRLDAAVTPLMDLLIEQWLREGHRYVVMDFSAVDFMDSTGLGCLVMFLKKLGDGGKLALCGVSVKIMSLFKLTRMDRIFQIHGSREEAVAHLGVPSQAVER